VVQTSTLCMEDGRKTCYKFFCVVIDKTSFVRTKCHVTIKTLEFHVSRHIPGGAYATPPLGWIADRPVFIVTRVQSYDIGKCLGWSSNRHGWLWHMPRPCQHISDKVSRKSLCEIFFPPHEDKRM